jgi:hypothetical protein
MGSGAKMRYEDKSAVGHDNIPGQVLPLRNFAFPLTVCAVFSKKAEDM